MTDTSDVEFVCSLCEGPLPVAEQLAEARRLLIAYPRTDPDRYDAVRTENLLGSIAASLLVIASALTADPAVLPAST